MSCVSRILDELKNSAIKEAVKNGAIKETVEVDSMLNLPPFPS